MTKSNKIVFYALNIIVWIIFVGLSIEASGLIVNFIYSQTKPESIQFLYQKLDLSNVFSKSIFAFYSIYSFLLVISILKTLLFYQVIRLLNKLDMSNPFSVFVSKQITIISYYTLSIGLLSHIASQILEHFHKRGISPNSFDGFLVDSSAFILMAAVIYVIAAIFKRGVEIQSENDLTV